MASASGMDGDGRQIEILCPVPDTQVGNSAVAYACSGQAALKFILGEPERRSRLFAREFSRDRAAIALRDGVVAGYATFTLGGRGPYAPSFGDFRREYGVPRGLLGYMLFYLVESRHRSPNLYIYGINVKLPARRSGVGSALVDALRSEAVRASCAAVELEVASQNQEAIGFYARKGFVVKKVLRLGPLRHVLRYAEVTKMALPLTG
jgi:ribosomal protein S18 acetylase RimI-like enzyme